ncbi:exonuclease V subunit gamma [Mannheimia haemolytica]|uniref:Exonuclease V subunit gamma n=1 Tax=Mannheimia haemolytica TaxID=75985 RepID=A0A378MX13_MANHA|nr:exonuclease V subunit gamma [Mannheimia haemolytica]
MKESPFNAEELFDLLEVNAIQTRFGFSTEDIHTLRVWVRNAGVRSGVEIEQPHWQNYNSWENGLKPFIAWLKPERRAGDLGKHPCLWDSYA